MVQKVIFSGLILLSSQQCRPLWPYVPLRRLVTVSWPPWCAMHTVFTHRPLIWPGYWTDRRSLATWSPLNSWITATGATRCIHTWIWCSTEESVWAAEWSTAAWRNLSSFSGVSKIMSYCIYHCLDNWWNLPVVVGADHLIHEQKNSTPPQASTSHFWFMQKNWLGLFTLTKTK